VIETLEPGEVLGVLGKNPAGDWLYVVSVDLTMGWMPRESLRVVGALDEAPVLPPDPIAAALARVTSPSSSGQAGGTPSQTIDAAELEPVTTARVSNAALNLRQRPGGQYTLLTTLSQDDEVTVLALNRDKQWGLVETADGRLGWGSIELMDVTGSLANAPQVRTLAPGENYPADQAAPVVALSASASAVSASSTAGSVSPTAAAVTAVSVAESTSPPGNSLTQLSTARVIEKVDMLRGPGESFGPVATLTVDEPVSIRGVNEARDWVVVTATNGRVGWVPLATLALDAPLAEAPPVLTAWVQSNDLDVKTGPGIFFENAGKLAINNLVSIIALNEGRSWALVETLPGGQGWIQLRFLTISGNLANTPQFDPASVASSTSAEPDVAVPGGPPAGRLVFQTSSGGDIMLINADGTGLRRLTYGIDPVLSPDGQKVAFTRWEGDTGTLWEINVDGSGERPILGETRQAKGPDWSPDGSQIVLNFQHGGRLEEKVSCLGLDGGRPNVPRNATNLRLSVSGRVPELCFDLPPDPQWGLRVVDVTDGSFEDLFGGFYAFRPTWDPDQSWRVVSDSGSGLLAVDVNRADFRQPLTDKVEDGAPVFSPDGRFIALVTDVQGGHDIFRMNRDGSGRVRLTQTPLWVPVQPDSDGSQWNNVSPAWSADSSRIAFLTDRTGRWEIWLMNADGSDQRPMFSEEINDQLDISYEFVDERVLSWR
jgi:TolB protein